MGQERIAVKAQKHISIIIPVYEEADNIDPLLDRLDAVLANLPYRHEVIFIDDGSRDGTWKKIVVAHQRYSYVKGFRLSRNFGQQSALLAGLRMASGDAIISMDGDLQHPPETIPELVREWEKGALIVQTERIDGQVTGFFKRASSDFFLRLFSFLSETRLEKGTSDFRLLDKRVVKPLLEMENAFLRGSVEWVGFPKATVRFEVDKRLSGKSKYNIKALLRLAYHALVAHSTKPLRVGIWLGLVTSIIAFGELLYVFMQYMAGNTVPGWASVIGITSLLFSVLFVLIGIVGIYIAEIHRKIMRRPDFIIGASIGNEPADEADNSSLTEKPPQ